MHNYIQTIMVNIEYNLLTMFSHKNLVNNDTFYFISYLGLTPDLGASLALGLLDLRTSQSGRGFLTGLITEIVWPRSRLKDNGGRADGSSLPSKS